jgi:hypothetical protein
MKKFLLVKWKWQKAMPVCAGRGHDSGAMRVSASMTQIEYASEDFCPAS